MDVGSENAGTGAEPKGNRLFLFLSGLSGWSLAIVGGLSLVVSSFIGSLAGVLVSIALVGHGAFELRLRRAFQSTGIPLVGRKMGWNQVGLAASVSVYLAYQVSVLDEELVMALLVESPVYAILEMQPEGLRQDMIELMPAMVGVTYMLAALATWIVCIGTAFYYWRATR